MLGYIVILFPLPDYAASVGMTKQQGSISTAMLNPGMAFGRPLAGLSSDYFGRINISGNMTLLSALNCFFIWIFPKTFAVALVFSLVSGAVCGVFWTTISPVVVEVVGIEELPRALSLTWLWITLPTTFSKPIGLYLRRPGVHNEYLYPQIFSGVMYLAATGCMYALRIWLLGRIDANKSSSSSSSLEEEEVVMSGNDKSFMQKWRGAGRVWRYAKV